MKQILIFLLVFDCDLLSADYLNDLVKTLQLHYYLFNKNVENSRGLNNFAANCISECACIKYMQV